MVYEVEVLTDWQNVLAGWRATTGNRGCSDVDAYDVVIHLVDHVRSAIGHFRSREPCHVTAWVYGSGIKTQDVFGMHVRAALNSTRIAEPSLKITLNPVDRPVHSAGEPLQVELCPYDVEHECRSSGCTRKIREQKLADTMIVADAAYLGMYANFGLVIVSDDHDMVPGLLVAANLRRAVGGDPPHELIWYRPGRGVADYRTRYERHFLTIGAGQ